jgi:hypothetical protein
MRSPSLRPLTCIARHLPLPAAMALLVLAGAGAHAMPEFARQYNVSCNACHSAFPKLNAFGDQFAAWNFKMPHWRQAIAQEIGDELLALPARPPFAIRLQTFVQWREGEEIDPAIGPTGNDASFDFQTPYLIKLLSSAPLSDNLTYYFYGIFAEKGRNGEILIEDAWVRHDDVFGTGVAMQLGQFQISDLMFPREIRLTFQDYYVYRAGQLTYDRGVLFDRDFGGFSIGLGAVNGNGIEQNFPINSPGFRRPDRMFDHDTSKTFFGRVGTTLGPVDAGLFGLAGRQRSAGGFAGTAAGARNTDRFVAGIDLAGEINPQLDWYAQVLWNRWESFLDLDPAQDYDWLGGFIGVDYVPSDRWSFSLLYNYAEADDFRGTGTIFEGIRINSLALNASYYVMRNVKVIVEANADFLGTDRGGPPFVGHQTREHYLLLGFDLAL